MTKPLRKDELDKIPKDGIDLKDFILQVASNNNWVFDYEEYRTAIVNAENITLNRVETTLKELEDDRFIIKQSGRRIYMVTTKGIMFHKRHEVKSIADSEDEAKSKIDDVTDNNTELIEETHIKDYDYNTIKLNRTADSIEAVETKVAKTSNWVAIATGVSAIAIIIQIVFSIFWTIKISGQLDTKPIQATQEPIKKEVKKTIEKVDRLSLRLDSLEMELQKLTKK